MKRTITIVFSGLLIGCVSQKTALINENGQVVYCEHAGFGWLGAPVSMAQHHECIKRAKAAGYAETQATARKGYRTQELNCSTVEKDGKLESVCK